MAKKTKLLALTLLLPMTAGAAFIRTGDTVSWQGATPSQWQLSYLGSDAAFTNTFSFSMGDTIFSTATSDVGDTAYATGDFSFTFTSPLGSVNEDNNNRVVRYFANIIDTNTVQLWLDDGGAHKDRDFNDMGVGVSAVPIPAAAWLFGTALLGLAAVGRRRENHSA